MIISLLTRVPDGLPKKIQYKVPEITRHCVSKRKSEGSGREVFNRKRKYDVSIPKLSN